MLWEIQTQTVVLVYQPRLAKAGKKELLKKTNPNPLFGIWFVRILTANKNAFPKLIGGERANQAISPKLLSRTSPANTHNHQYLWGKTLADPLRDNSENIYTLPNINSTIWDPGSAK